MNTTKRSTLDFSVHLTHSEVWTNSQRLEISFLMPHSFWFQKLRFHRFTSYVLLIMDAPSSAAAAPSEILDLAAVPRPMQQRVHIVVQVDWFQIAEKFLPRPDEETDIRDLTVAVMTTEEELNFYIDMTKQVITNYLWAQFRQNLRKREFCLKLIHPHTAELVSLNWDDTWRETLVSQSIPFNVGLLQIVLYPSLDFTFQPQPVVRLNNPVGNPWIHFYFKTGKYPGATASSARNEKWRSSVARILTVEFTDVSHGFFNDWWLSFSAMVFGCFRDHFSVWFSDFTFFIHLNLRRIT